MVIHMFDRYEDSKIPNDNQTKANGYKASICGYQRKYTTVKEYEVTCKLCLKIISESHKEDDKNYLETLESLKRDMY